MENKDQYETLDTIFKGEQADFFVGKQKDVLCKIKDKYSINVSPWKLTHWIKANSQDINIKRTTALDSQGRLYGLVKYVKA